LVILSSQHHEPQKSRTPPLDEKVEKNIRDLRITLLRRGQPNRPFKIARLTSGSATETQFTINLAGDCGEPVEFETTVEH
ncbi:hypothetical protein BGZ65_012274, partial [Modicella reniformis]